MPRDPRQSAIYRKRRREFIANADPVCCMCGKWIAIGAPGTHPLGPTIEHRLAVRDIMASAVSQQACDELAADTTYWALAHRKCNDAQGARVTSRINAVRNGARRRSGSRDW